MVREVSGFDDDGIFGAFAATGTPAKRARRTTVWRRRLTELCGAVALSASLAACASAAREEAALPTAVAAAQVPAEEVVRSDLTPAEVFRRLLDALEQGSLEPENVERIFGIPAESSQPSPIIRILAFPEQPANWFHRFVYRRQPCSSQALPPTVKCEGEFVLNLFVSGPFGPEEPSAGERPCPRSRDVISRLIESGWDFTIPPDVANPIPIDPHRLAPDFLSNGRTQVMIMPPSVSVRRCIAFISVFSPGRGE